MPRWEDWLFAQKPGFFGELARSPLWALSGIYWLAVKARLLGYKKGFFPSEKINLPVISVGNLSLGGSGKTPLVIWLAEKLSQRGLKPAVSIRGYRSQAEKSLVVLTPGSPSPSPILVGDEARLIFQKLESVPVLVGRDRVEAGRKAGELGAELLILDDGFQHLRLKRDLDLVLIDSRRNIFKEKLFPRGRLREPLSELKRAGVLIFSRAEEEPGWRRELERFHPQAKIFKMCYQVKNSGELAGKRAFAFAGIAHPQDFFQLAQRVKINLVGSWSFSDHHLYKEKEVRQIEKKAKEKGAEILLTTEKDAVRLEGFEFGLPLKTLEIQLDFFGEEEELLGFLLSCLNREGKDAQGN